MLVTALHDTWLKPSRAESSTIDKKDMYLLEQGATYSVTKVGPLTKSHYLLTLDEPLQGFRDWYVYSPHVRINGMPKGVNLDVPYHPQYDNGYSPSTSCFATSASMAMAYYGVRPKGSNQLEDELYLYLSDNGLDRFSWQDIAYLLSKHGCKGVANMSGTFVDIKAALDNGYPVILGTYFTHAGHIVLVKGYDADGLICHDPWGTALGAGQYHQTKTGKDVHYSWSFVSEYASDIRGPNPTDLWIMPVRRA
jgi:hypothetical protein